MIFEYVRANRNRTLSLGAIMIAVGLIIGVSYSLGGTYIHTVISYILLFGISSLGGLLFVYGYYIKFYNNPKLLLVKSIAFMVVLDIFIYLDTLVQFEYYSVIVYAVFVLGLNFMEKGKLK